MIAYSSGNHALAVATAARVLGIEAVVVMPSDAPAPKMDGAHRAGAELVLYDRSCDDRESICLRLSASRGLTLIRPYDDGIVIAGQGTVALEALEQAAAAGVRVESMFVPCSGGGLAAGCAIISSAMAPWTRVVTVEPEGFDDTARSLATGRTQRNISLEGSICDALLVPTPGKLTLPVLRRQKVQGSSVSDAAVFAAMAFALRTLKLALEPAGAICLAAVMNEVARERGDAVIAILSGGNVSDTMLIEALGASRVQCEPTCLT